MDTDVLVENRIEDGQKLIAELVGAEFDVSVAFWAKTTEDGLWFLYIGSNSVEQAKIGDAYLTLYACLKKIQGAWVGLSEVMLIQASNPVAKDAIAARDRQTGILPVRVRGNRLGNLSVEEAYIYPRVGGQMTPNEILQALLGMASRPAGAYARPSVIRLRNGDTVNGIITGFSLQMPGGVTISTLEPASNTTAHISGEDVVSIQ